MGVITTCQLDVGTIFGPLSPNATVVDLTILIGHRTCDTTPDIHTVTLDLMEYSRSEQLLSEWIPFVQAARRSSEQNVEISLDHCNGRRSLFYKVIRSVTPNSELFAWYSDQLAEELGLPVVRDDCRKDDGSYSCPNCDERFCYSNCLRAHMRFRCRARSNQQTAAVKLPRNSSPIDTSTSPTTTGDAGACSSPAAPRSSAFDDVTNMSLPISGDHGNGKPATKRRVDRTFDSVDAMTPPKRSASYSLLPPDGGQLSGIQMKNVVNVSSTAALDISSGLRNAFHRAAAERLLSVSGLQSSSAMPVTPPSPSLAMSSFSPPACISGIAAAASTDVLSPSSLHTNVPSFVAPAISLASSSLSGAVFPGIAGAFPVQHRVITNENLLPYHVKGVLPELTAAGRRPNHGLIGHLGNGDFMNANRIKSPDVRRAPACDPLIAASGLHSFAMGGQNPLIAGGMLRSGSSQSAAAAVAAAAALITVGGPAMPSVSSPAPSSLQAMLPPLHMAQNWCAKCNTGFRMTSDLVHHMRTHHKRESDPQATPDDRISGSSSSAGSLGATDRFGGATGGKTPLRCDVCHELFRERHHLTRHMTSHT